MYAQINNNSELDVFAEETDKCYLCRNMNKCPLMATIKNEIVILRFEAMAIEECGMFESIIPE